MAKRLILLFTCIFIFSTSTYSFANSKENIVNGDLSIEDGATSALPSETDQVISAQKLKEIDSLLQESTSTAMSKSSTDFEWNYVLSIPVYNQQKSYWCGPATLKEVVQYHKGSSKSIASYATSLGTTTDGTDMKALAKAVKKFTGKNYVYYQYHDLSTWKKCVGGNIQFNKRAVIMDIKTDTSFWKYKTNGHFLPIKGIKGSATNFTMVKLADPHYKYAANYNVKVANAYKANTSHWRQAIIW